MTKDELTELADDCWEDKNGLNTFNHLKFAALVAAHEREKATEYRLKLENVLAGCEAAVLAEREACAKVCDDLSAHYWEKDFPVESINCEECAAAIRARGEK